MPWKDVTFTMTMKDITAEMRCEEQQSFPLTLLTTQIREERYGAAPCTVTLFGAQVDAIAVTAGQDNKHVNTREHATSWLTEHGLNVWEAGLLIDLAIEVDKHRVPTLSEQEIAGQYEEEAQKIIDGVAEDIRLKKLRTMEAALFRARSAAENSAYVRQGALATTLVGLKGNTSDLRKLALTYLRKDVEKLLHRCPEYRAFYEE